MDVSSCCFFFIFSFVIKVETFNEINQEKYRNELIQSHFIIRCYISHTMSYWCQRSAGTNSDIHCNKSILKQIMAINNITNWDIIENRIKVYPHEVSEKDRFGVTALHHIIRKQQRQQQSDSNNKVPLHIVRLLIKEYPNSLVVCDSMTGCNALHVACMKGGDGMMDIIMTILNERPESAMQICNEGRIALHRCKDVQVAQRLIDIYPKGIGHVTQQHKYLPIHDACSDNNVSPEMIQFLLDQGRKYKVGESVGDNLSCGGLLVKDLHGDIPIKIIFRRVMFLKSSSSSAMLSSSLSNETNNVTNETKIDDIFAQSPLWRKMSIVVKSTFLAMHGTSISTIPLGNCDIETECYHNIPLVHSIIECGGPPKLVKYALQLYPHEVNLRDDYGRVPLSIACSKVDIHPEMFELLLDKKSDNDENVNDHGHEYEFGGEDMNTITNKAATASMANNQGRLPLHLAVESGRTLKNGVELIANAAPMALQTRDIKTGMYPFMLASIPSYKWDNTCIDTIYSLVRTVPHVLRNYCPERREDDNDKISEGTVNI